MTFTSGCAFSGSATGAPFPPSIRGFFRNTFRSIAPAYKATSQNPYGSRACREALESSHSLARYCNDPVDRPLLGPFSSGLLGFLVVPSHPHFSRVGAAKPIWRFVEFIFF
ncbi:hypothetical protein OPV22_001945 [Ensete ventricosum]|uniref:Protein dehydration-induced 19 C-terminal domain-containing protein n=1 Tax=Ensete ventricosum TaxID=4639 RepID=A0AAV8RT53_ENSVE|nr:hypothetical protein OPV22_001945 [Ensete ventricosum]